MYTNRDSDIKLVHDSDHVRLGWNAGKKNAAAKDIKAEKYMSKEFQFVKVLINNF